ncbi:MAG: transcription antitermination factor NusB [Pseudomonadota bacterium]
MSAMAGKKGQPGAGRSAARFLAVQALYQASLSDISVDRLLAEFEQHRLQQDLDGADLLPADLPLFRDLVKGASAAADRLDDMLAAVLDEDWTVERLDLLLRALLRAGIYELSERLDVPARVVVSEYVDLAHAFFHEREPGMVNGMLDRLARDLRIEEFEPAHQPPD